VLGTVFQRIDQTRGFFEWGTHWYDAVRNRTAEMQWLPGTRGVTHLWIMNLWHLNPPTRLEVNLTSNPPKCNKTNITYPFRYYGVGPNDTFSTDEIIGSTAIQNGYVECSSWSYNWQNGSDHHTLTRRGCVPVTRLTITNNTKPEDVREELWFDVVIGITNPQIFVPPPECNVTQAELEWRPSELEK